MELVGEAGIGMGTSRKTLLMLTLRMTTIYMNPNMFQNVRKCVQLMVVGSVTTHEGLEKVCESCK